MITSAKHASAALDFFATEDVVAALEAALALAQDSGRLTLSVALSWQLRQRDTQRATAMAMGAQQSLLKLSPSDPEQRLLSARVNLILGEAKWLVGDLDISQDLAGKALREYTELGDALGCADAYWLQAWIADAHGHSERRKKALESMFTASQGVDTVRATMAQATIARFAAFSDPVEANAQWASHFDLVNIDAHPAAACSIEDFLGILRFNLHSDYAHSIQHHTKTYALALESGQIRRAIITATNLGEAFDDLNDHHTAIDWMRRGLELARVDSWPYSLCIALTQTAGTLRYLQRLDTAHAMLQEALDMMASMTASRSYATALRNMGDVEYDLQHYTLALEAFEKLEPLSLALGQGDLLSYSLLGQARGLLRLDQVQPALEKAHAALAATANWTIYQISAMRVLADIHAHHPQLKPPPAMYAANASLHYLLQAMELASTIENFTMPGELLDDVAKAYAAIGWMDRAYSTAIQANVARESTHSAQTISRANAMQVRHETERIRAEAEHHRQLAAAHAERADTLLKAKVTLEQLGDIGREITGNLETAAIFSTLNRHVHALLDVTTFAIDRLESDGVTLRTVFGVEAGSPLPPYHYRIDNPHGNAARCARDRVEIVIHDVLNIATRLVPDTLHTESQLFAPLQVGKRLLGVMTVQSVNRNAYSEREVAIFRTLCAYGAIALANSEAQAQLLQSQKLASLGRLVAGVAHALNTPLGNGLMAVSTLRDSLHEFQREAASSGVKRKTFDSFLEAVEDGSMLAMRNIDRGASLVSSFKQIAVDQKAASRSIFLLKELLNRLSNELHAQYPDTSHRWIFTADTTLQMDSYPDALTETIRRMVNNAFVHGFGGREGGQISIDCQLCDADHVSIVVENDGPGIALADQAKVFDPFFTTCMAQSPGLGLHIAHSNVTQLLMGSIEIQSGSEQGCSFKIVLPLVAPSHGVIT